MLELLIILPVMIIHMKTGNVRESATVYLEESIFLRLFVLFFGITLLFWVPAAMVGVVDKYLL